MQPVRPVDLHLHEDLRRVVAHLRAHDGDRPARLRLAAIDEQHVRGLAPLQEGPRPQSARLGRLAGHHGIDLLERARVDHRDRLGAPPASVRVGKAPARGRRGVAVVEVAEVVVDALPRPAAEALAERLVGERDLRLLAAALAEDPADQRRDRNRVGRLPVLDLLAEGRVLDGHLVGVRARLRDVGVDAIDVVDEVLLHLRALGSRRLGGAVHHLLQLFLVVVGDEHLRGVHLDVRGSRQLAERGASGVAEHVHQEQPVVRRRVPRAEHRVGSGLAEDLRDAEGVPVDLHTRPRRRLERGSRSGRRGRRRRA